MKVFSFILITALSLALGFAIIAGCGDDDDDNNDDNDDSGDDDSGAGSCEGEKACYEDFESCALASEEPADYWSCGLTWQECVNALGGCSADFLSCQDACEDDETCIEDTCVPPYVTCLDECCDGACVEECSTAYETCADEAPIDIDAYHECSQTFANCMDPCY